MQLNKFVLGALLAFGSALGASVQAQSVNYGMHICCEQLQCDCDEVYGPEAPRCVGLYERCIASRHCIIE